MRIVVGLSGGVDSAVAAWLLQEQGHEVTGVFMHNWAEEDGTCSAEADFEDVRRVSEHLKIPYYSVNFQQEYRDRVFAEFLQELQQGHTPNPDVLCNTHIKFQAFLNYALTAGAEFLATGHYAGVAHEPQGAQLLRADDENKDQTYFLHGLNQGQLCKVLFPLQTYTKPQVRELALRIGLPVAQKKDSTGICFIGERQFRAFLQQHLPAQPGDMVTPEGRVVGRHEGLAFYTLGQRRGLGIGGTGSGQRWFVVAKDLSANRLIVHQGDTPLLYTQTLTTGPAHFIGPPPPSPLRCMARLRHRQPLQACTLDILPDGRAHVTFDQPQRAATPGQFVVWYDGRICLGGGKIA